MGIQLNAPVRAASTAGRRLRDACQELDELKHNERLVYEALSKSKRPQKAYDLLESLQDYGLRAPMTIYRALDALIVKGHVKKIESLNAFIAVRSGQATRARAFLICKECMQAKEIALDEQQILELFSPLLVEADDVRIEAFGDCHQVCGR